MKIKPEKNTNDNASQLATDAMDVLDHSNTITENPYTLMADEARDNLFRIMHNTDNEKLSKEISIAVLDRAGETAHVEQKTTVAVSITDDQIQLLVQTAQEIN